MRILPWLMAASIGPCAISPGLTQVPDVLFRGTVRATLSHGSGSWCAIELGPTLFQRPSPKEALISFPALHYTLTTTSPLTYYTLSGDARMTFATAASGTLKFDHPNPYPDAVLRPQFSQYSETYNAATGNLVVKFRVKFETCNLIVSNIYWD